MTEELPPTMKSTKLWVALSLAARTVRQKIEAKLKVEGLPDLNWFEVLFKLAQSPDGVRPFELEAYTLFEQPNISRLVKRMVDKGYAVELPFPGDRRGKLLKITPSGDVFVRKMWKIYGEEVNALMEEVSKKHDSEAFFNMLVCLLDAPQLERIFSGKSDE